MPTLPKYHGPFVGPAVFVTVMVVTGVVSLNVTAVAATLNPALGWRRCSPRCWCCWPSATDSASGTYRRQCAHSGPGAGDGEAPARRPVIRAGSRKTPSVRTTPWHTVQTRAPMGPAVDDSKETTWQT